MTCISKYRSTVRSTRIAVGLGLSIIAMFIALAPPASAAYGPNQWSLRFSGAPTTNAPFSLYNQDTRDEMVYGVQKWCGINLVWNSKLHRDWRFVRAGGSTGSIRYDEPLALYNIPQRKYVYYTYRYCGINLNWSSGPQFQWRLRGGTTGSQINPTNLGLWNDTEDDYLVYGWRPAGVNLKWFKDTQGPAWCHVYDSAPGC